MKQISLKFVLFSFLFFSPVVISGCWNWNCNCKPSPETYFDVRGMIGGVYKSQSARVALNTLGSYKATDFYIGLFADMTYYGFAPTLCGGGSLQACDCVSNAGEKGSKEIVKAISVTSNQEFMSSYPAGTTLDAFVRLSAYYPKGKSLYQLKIQDFLVANPTAPENIEFVFDREPVANKKHIFTIRYELDNGEVYSYTTPEITFQ